MTDLPRISGLLTAAKLLLLLVVSSRAQLPFSAPVASSSANIHTLISMADVDGDGDTDILQSLGGNSVNFLINDGSGGFAFSSSLQLPAGHSSFRARFGDFDGNGTTDIVSYAITATTTTVAVLPGLGGGTFGAPIIAFVAPFAFALEIGDGNGDGIDDVLISYQPTAPFSVPSATSRLTWFFGSAGFVFTSGSTFDTLGESLFVADLDGDGDDDALQRASLSNPQPLLYVSLTSGSSWVSGGPLTLGPVAAPFVTTGVMFTAGDFDGDGDQDVVGCYRTTNTSGPGFPVIRARVFLRDAVGWVPLMHQDLRGDAVNGAEFSAGDFDGDGDDDLILRAVSRLSFFESLGNGILSEGRITTIPQLAIAMPAPGFGDLNGDAFSDYVNPRDIILSSGVGGIQGLETNGVVVDFDHDGDLDVLGTTFSLHENRGNGRFRTTPLPLGFLPSLSMGMTWQLRESTDVDGDGFEDFLADLTIPGFLGPVPVETHLLLNQRGVAAIDLGPVAGPNGLIPTNFRLADVNADNVDDIIVDGMIHFGASSTPFATLALPLGYDPTDSGDPDGDGDVDILMVDIAFTHGLWLFRNDGAASFPIFPLTTAFVPNGCARFADLDADGDLDVAFLETLSSNSSRFVTLENVGVSMPPVRRDFTVPIVANGLSVGDFDDDGYTDLVARGNVFTSIGAAGSIALRNVGGTFVFDLLPPFLAPTSSLEDLDGDGDLDLFGPNVYGNRAKTPMTSGRYSQYGEGTPGTDGLVPVLGTRGPWNGGSTVDVLASRALGGTVGALAIGAAPDAQLATPIAGIDLFVSQIVSVIPFGTTGAPGVGGVGTFGISGVVPLGITSSLYLQAAYYDPGAPSGFCCTNGLRIDLVP